MIKIFVLLASTWAVMGFVPTGDSDFYGYKLCVLNRIWTHTGLGLNCKQRMGDESQLDQLEINHIMRNFYIVRDMVKDGREKRGNPGPQPAAEHMEDFEWDDELVTHAYNWARECIPERDPCTEMPESAGQTISTQFHANKYDSDVLKMWVGWHDEVKYFDKNLVAKFNPDPETLAKIGNYSQIVWGKTRRVGCSKSVDFNGTMYRTTFVCNYWPKGNILGEPVYKIHPNWTNDKFVN